jgi:hypothetical protein
MFYGKNKDGQLIEANKGLQASCPLCEMRLVAKCGIINAAHWAHHSAKDCDPLATLDSDWAISWKQRVPKENCEVVFTWQTKNGELEKHRADIVIPSKNEIVLLNDTSLTGKQVIEKERFFTRFGRVKWLLHDTGLFWVRDNNGYKSFRWRWPHKALWTVRNLFVELDHGVRVPQNPILKVHKIYPQVPCGGWGNIVDQTEIIGKGFQEPNYKENL